MVSQRNQPAFVHHHLSAKFSDALQIHSLLGGQRAIAMKSFPSRSLCNIIERWGLHMWRIILKGINISQMDISWNFKKGVCWAGKYLTTNFLKGKLWFVWFDDFCVGNSSTVTNFKVSKGCSRTSSKKRCWQLALGRWLEPIWVGSCTPPRARRARKDGFRQKPNLSRF